MLWKISESVNGPLSEPSGNMAETIFHYYWHKFLFPSRNVFFFVCYSNTSYWKTLYFEDKIIRIVEQFTRDEKSKEPFPQIAWNLGEVTPVQVVCGPICSASSSVSYRIEKLTCVLVKCSFFQLKLIPHVAMEEPMHSKRVTLWCHVWTSGIIGPRLELPLLPASIFYRPMLRDYLLRNVKDNDINDVWFRQTL